MFREEREKRHERLSSDSEYPERTLVNEQIDNYEFPIESICKSEAPLCFCSALQSLLSVHDAVAQRDFEPTLPPMPDDVLEEDEDSVKIVSLVKTKEPLVSQNIFHCQKSR